MNTRRRNRYYLGVTDLDDMFNAVPHRKNSFARTYLTIILGSIAIVSMALLITAVTSTKFFPHRGQPVSQYFGVESGATNINLKTWTDSTVKANVRNISFNLDANETQTLRVYVEEAIERAKAEGVNVLNITVNGSKSFIYKSLILTGPTSSASINDLHRMLALLTSLDADLYTGDVTVQSLSDAKGNREVTVSAEAANMLSFSAVNLQNLWKNNIAVINTSDAFENHSYNLILTTPEKPVITVSASIKDEESLKLADNLPVETFQTLTDLNNLSYTVPILSASYKLGSSYNDSRLDVFVDPKQRNAGFKTTFNNFYFSGPQILRPAPYLFEVWYADTKKEVIFAAWR